MSKLGPVGVKIMGFTLNVARIKDWWLLGYGWSFQRPRSVSSNAIPYDDPGLVQLIFLESGVVAGFLFTFILFQAILIGLKSEQMGFLSAGIFAWWLFALSSWEVWPLLLVASICCLIILGYESYLKSITAEIPHNRH